MTRRHFCIWLHRCGLLQEGDRVLAINGQYVEGHTMDDVQEFIRDSRVKMIVSTEFNVAGMCQCCCVLCLYSLCMR